MTKWIITLPLSFSYVGSNNVALSLSTFDSICAALSLHRWSFSLLTMLLSFMFSGSILCASAGGIAPCALEVDGEV